MNYEQSNKAWIRLSQGTETEKTDQDEYWAKHKWTASLLDYAPMTYNPYNPRDPSYGRLSIDTGC